MSSLTKVAAKPCGPSDARSLAGGTESACPGQIRPFCTGSGNISQAGILWHQAERLVFRICQVNDGIAIARFYLCGEANRAGDRQQEIFPDQRDAPKVQGIIIGVVNNKIKAALSSNSYSSVDGRSSRKIYSWRTLFEIGSPQNPGCRRFAAASYRI
mgnify:CR=1 FL=1